MGLVSPDAMMKAAKDHMLDGREPASKEDWQLVVNFLAFNTHHEIVKVAMPVMKAIYKIPLSDEHIAEIVEFQLSRPRS
jgi:hypothetical protein